MRWRGTVVGPPGRGTHRGFLDLAVARLDAPLSSADAAWLEAHLATCDPCREWVAGYAADRTALQRLRRLPAPPPDLWARTSAALDREAPRRRPPSLLGRPVSGRTARAAVTAALSLVLLVVAAGSGLIPGFPGTQPSMEPLATPFAVEPRILAYISMLDGEVGVYVGRIARVCPEPVAGDCLPLESDVTKVASFTDFVPQQLAVSPDGRAAAVVGTSSRGGAVDALRFPEPDAATPSPAQASSEPTGATPTTEQTAAISSPAGSPSLQPTGEPEPALIIENVVVVGEPPAYSADGAMLAFSAMPADGSSGPDIYLWRPGDAAAVPLTDDHGSIFASWAGQRIVGSRGVPAPEGSSGDEPVAPMSFVLDPVTAEMRDLARPAWRPVVDPTGRFVIFWDGSLVRSADDLTWNEASGGLYFAEWALFDGPIGTPGGEVTPEPGGEVTPEPTDGPPAQPTGSPAQPTGSPGPTAPADETSEPTDRPAEATSEPTAGATAEPTADGSAEPTAGEAPSPPAEPEALVANRDYGSAPILSWEVRWSPDGQWFGVWIGDRDPGEPGSDEEPGHLTVGAVDRDAGRIDRTRIELLGTPALRGFALGQHRIAWATLPGDDGGSEIRLLVWSETGRGEIGTTPGRGHNTLPAL